MKDLRNKRGFVWNHNWFPNPGNDHEHNAIEIMYKYSKIYPNENWDWHTYNNSPLDFFILKKKAIQLASGDRFDCIIASGYAYDENFFDKFKTEHNLQGYDVFLIW